MTKMLDILGDYCNMKKWKFSRLDGSMNFLDRQANIDKFNTDPEHTIFLLSTRYLVKLSMVILIMSLIAELEVLVST
jgi:hypothetical protein